jgi:hypothetical protein
MIPRGNVLAPLDLDLLPMGFHIKVYCVSLAFRMYVNGLKQHSYEDKGDEWTLAFINMLNVQPVIEAFDFDVSGFISIREANELASLRPKSWR